MVPLRIEIFKELKLSKKQYIDILERLTIKILILNNSQDKFINLKKIKIIQEGNWYYWKIRTIKRGIDKVIIIVWIIKSLIKKKSPKVQDNLTMRVLKFKNPKRLIFYN